MRLYETICNTLGLSNQEFAVRFFKHRRWAINNCDFIHWSNGGRQWKPWGLTIKYCLFQEFATIEFEASKMWVLTATNMFWPSNTMFFLIKMMNPTRMEKKRVHCLGYYSKSSMKQLRILRPHQKRGLQLSLEEKCDSTQRNWDAYTSYGHFTKCVTIFQKQDAETQTKSKSGTSTWIHPTQELYDFRWFEPREMKVVVIKTIPCCKIHGEVEWLGWACCLQGLQIGRDVQR